MRLKSLFLLDLRFQAKYGFYFLYAVITLIYVTVLLAVPQHFQAQTAAILIFSDPASIGLFFMGAIVLLEKDQHTPCAFAVSPVRPAEYIFAKLGSLCVISLAVAAVLAFAADVRQPYIVLPATLISSAVFTLLGIIVAANISSLNQFLLWTVPVEAACFVPAILHMLQITPAWLQYAPVNICMDMILGHVPSVTKIVIVMAFLTALFVLAKNCVTNMWNRMGGVKL